MKFYEGGMSLERLENMTIPQIERYVGYMNRYIETQNREIEKARGK